MKLKKLPYFDKVLNKLIEIDPCIVIDISACLINERQLKKFKRFLPASFSGSYQQGIASLVATVVKKLKNWEEILYGLVKMNTAYLEHSSYLTLDRKQLKAEFDKDMVPSLHSTGVSPEMIIFYYYSKHKFDHPDIPFLIDCWREKDKEVQEHKEVHNIELDPPLRGSQAEMELNQYAEETELKPQITHDLIRPIAEKLNSTYDEKSKTVTLKRGIVYYFYNRLNSLIDAEEWFDRALRLIFKQVYAFNRQVERVLQIKRERDTFLDENAKLKKKVKRLEKEKASLLALKKNTPDSLERENAGLKKQLTYALSRIEQLEERTALLEEAKEINNEIEENLPIISPVRKIEIPDYGLVVISGGKWNSRTKEEALKFFDKYGIEVEFIDAEDTLKRQDRIANADLAIFDTSRHAHKYYLKIKELNRNILHIRKSNIDEVKKLFES